MQIYVVIRGTLRNSRENVVRSAEKFQLRKRSRGDYGPDERFLSEVNRFRRSSRLRIVSFRYPLAFAAYSNDVYGCLRDRSDNVRLAALKTISNLILKEMVKVRRSTSSDVRRFHRPFV